MKKPWLLVGIVFAGLGLSSITRGQEPAPPPFEKPETTAVNSNEDDIFDSDSKAPRLVQTQVEYIELSQEALTKLLFLRSPKIADATDLRKQLQDMVSKNEAKVLETQILVCRSGQKSTTESIHEYMFPTEYTPETQAKQNEKQEEPTKALVSSGVCAEPAMPSAFETRNVGSTLEIEPTVGYDNKTIDLRLVPELTWHTGDKTWMEFKDRNGNSNKQTMPDFYTLRVCMAYTCITGQYMFVAALSPKDSKGEPDLTRKIMVFVKCDVLTVK